MNHRLSNSISKYAILIFYIIGFGVKISQASTVTVVGEGSTDVCPNQTVSVQVDPDKVEPPPIDCCTTWTYTSTEYVWTGATGTSETASVNTSGGGDIDISVSMTHHWICNQNDDETTTTEDAGPLTIHIHNMNPVGPGEVGVGQYAIISASGQSDTSWSIDSDSNPESLSLVTLSDGTAQVYGLHLGDVVIRASSHGCSAPFTIHVKDEAPYITISSDQTWVEVGKTSESNFTATGGIPPYTFAASSTDTVSVDSTNGAITGVKAGTSAITATDSTGAVSDPVTATGYTVKVECDADVPENKNRKTVGIGETVKCSIKPDASGLKWVPDADGKGSVGENSGIYIAGDAKDDAQKINVSGSGGIKASVTFKVVAPVATHYLSDGLKKMHTKGTASAGFVAKRSFDAPSNTPAVSFSRADFQEQDANFSSKGIFLFSDGLSHFGSAGKPDYQPIDTDNTSGNYKDNVWSGVDANLPAAASGTQICMIDINYRNNDIEHLIMHQKHDVSATSDGTTTAKKNGTQVVFKYNDNDSP